MCVHVYACILGARLRVNFCTSVHVHLFVCMRVYVCMVVCMSAFKLQIQNNVLLPDMDHLRNVHCVERGLG